ncbi:hypothetical protein VF21_06952 [Pseudogymnoascus sp. 05NY08]|nr:hypothetical protein VF21_06952 [Pseudogymnoascus sp. 05NY08]
MFALPTPPVTPSDAAFFTVVTDITGARYPHRAFLIASLLRRSNYFPKDSITAVGAVAELQIVKAGPRMQNAMWGIDRVKQSERAEAAAILEAIVDRVIVSERNGDVLTRWLCDDEKKSGRVYDRLWGIETTRLIPWRYGATDYNGPSRVYDVLIGRVRRLQIQDHALFQDAKNNLGVWGREMEVTMELRGREDESEDEEDEDVEMRQESEEETEDDDSEEESSEDEKAEESHMEVDEAEESHMEVDEAEENNMEVDE